MWANRLPLLCVPARLPATWKLKAAAFAVALHAVLVRVWPSFGNESRQCNFFFPV